MGTQSMREAVGSILEEIEAPLEEKYSSKYEYYFFLYSIPFFLFNRVLAQLSDIEVWDQPANWGGIFYGALFSTFAYLSVVLIATPAADRWIPEQMKTNQGLIFALLLPLISLVYFMGGLLLALPPHLAWQETLEGFYWASCPWWLSATISWVGVFLGVRTVFLLAGMRENKKGLVAILRSLGKNENEDEPHNISQEMRDLERKFSLHFVLYLVYSPFFLLNFKVDLWIALLAPLAIFLLFALAKWPLFHQNREGVTLGDVLITAIGAGIAIGYQQTLPLLWALNLPIAVILLMYSTKLGREHFYYSFIPRSEKEIPEIINFVLFAILFFVPVAFIVGFIEPSEFTVDISIITLVDYMAIWIYLVGIAEEFIFRCIILILLKDVFKFRKGSEIKRPVLIAFILAAVLFGLSHASKGLDYAFLAIIAGLLYGYPFVKNKNLFGPVVLHAVVDVIAVGFLGAQL